jgi:c-di-GMP-binding flagellar brake protein YcgR
LVCPECNASKNTDVTEYKKLEKSVRLKVKCTCGNSYSVMLERRRSYRKETNLPGNYACRDSSGELEKGAMTVINISRGGVKFKTKVPPKFKVGATFDVTFQLDDKQKSIIRKEVVAANINDRFVGVEFCSVDPSDPSDKALGFYLF